MSAKQHSGELVCVCERASVFCQRNPLVQFWGLLLWREFILNYAGTLTDTELVWVVSAAQDLGEQGRQ